MVVQKLTDLLNDKIKQTDDEGESWQIADIFTPLWDVVRDGDIDTEDFDDLVEWLDGAIATAWPRVNIPRVPEIVEAKFIDPLVIKGLQAFSRQIVAFCFTRFNIPLPEDA